MTQEFDPLKILLTLLSTDPALGELPDVVAHLDPGQWDTLVSEAYRQDLGPLLYSFLVRQKEAFTLPSRSKKNLTVHTFQPLSVIPLRCMKPRSC